MDNLIKPKEQLIEELNELRGEIETLRTLEAEHKQTELNLQETFHELRVHQEELQTQNEQLRAARQELESSQRKYRFLFDFAPIGYFIIQDDTRVREVNLSGVDMLGYQRRTIIGKPFFLRVAPASRNKLNAHFRQVFEGKDDSVEVSFLHLNGSEVPVVLQSKLIRESLDMAPYCLTAAMDITGRKKAENALQATNQRLEQTLAKLKTTQERVLQQERLAAVGQLAAGIAHDFNNILTSIQGFAELLQLQADMPESAQSSLARIVEQSDRAAHLIRQVLDFSRKSIRQPKQFDLGPFLKEEVKFLQRTIPEHVHIRLEIGPEAYPVKADLTQLRQLLTNLAVNARDAMPGGGELILRLSRLSLTPDTQPPCLEMQPGEWVVMTVTDTGSGIPAEIQPRIFEPFFTTKDVGQGAGLGLAQVYGIVKQHEGYIDLDSRVGQGTTFTLYLPFQEATTNPLAELPPADIPRGQGEMVLVVEDESAVLETSQALLEHLNYRVLTAANGQEALTLYAEYQDEIVLILADMVMPHMDGVALYQALHAKNSDIKMVMMTGYPLGEGAPGVLTQGLVNWVQKPIRLAQLAQVVSRTLQG